jgi:fumarate reductase flavoprotein subunit
MIASSMVKNNLKSDLVIIGGGGSGLAAAVAAAEKGAKNITVLERRNKTGGTSAYADNYFAAESPAQKRQGITVNRDDFFKSAIGWAHLKIDGRIVRTFIDKSGDTIQWLEDKGLYFYCGTFFPNSLPCLHTTEGGGTVLMNVLADECRKLGVEVLYHSRARKILIGQDGNITGLSAEREGEEFTIKTKNIIIATGGYGGNKELLKKYCPQYHDKMRCDGLANEGDGLLMATEIGAATEGLGALMMVGPSVPLPIVFRLGNEPVRLKWLIREPYTIWLNKKGRRYVDEAVGLNYYESSQVVVRQTDNLSYSIFDSKILQRMAESPLEQNLFRTGQRAPSAPSTSGPMKIKPISQLPDGLEAGLREQADKGRVKISGTWDGLSDWMGVDRNVLRNTLEEYNDACEHGHDLIFAKDQKYLMPISTPPYYAVKCDTDFHNTVGGIKINENMEVLDKQENPISGLYAVGVDAGGWSSDVYQPDGFAIGFAINSGRIAGENAAKRIHAYK